MKKLFFIALILAVLMPSMSFAQARDSTVADTIIRKPNRGFGMFGFSLEKDEFSSINGMLLGYGVNQKTELNGLSVGAVCSMGKINGAAFGLWTEGETINGLNVGLLTRANKFRGINISGLGSGVDTTYGLQFATISIRGKLVEGISAGFAVVVEKVDGVLVGVINGGNVNGLQVGAYSAGSIKGLTLSAIYSNLDTLSGLNISPFNSTHKNRGVSLSLFNLAISQKDSLAQTSNNVNSGVELGGINSVDENAGLQLGLFNYTVKNRGLQFGLFNNTNKNRGLQIGLINISNNDLFPFVKWW